MRPGFAVRGVAVEAKVSGLEAQAHEARDGPGCGQRVLVVEHVAADRSPDHQAEALDLVEVGFGDVPAAAASSSKV